MMIWKGKIQKGGNIEMAQTTYVIDKRLGYDDFHDWFETYKSRFVSNNERLSNEKDFLQELERRVNEELPGSFVWQMRTSTILCDTEEKEDLPLPVFDNFVTSAIVNMEKEMAAEEKTEENYDYDKE